ARAIRDIAGNATAPAARCRNCLRWGSFMVTTPLQSSWKDSTSPITDRRSAVFRIFGLRLFDHLVGDGQQGRRHGQANRLGGCEIEDRVELGRLYTGQVGRLVAFENTTDVSTRLSVGLQPIIRIAHQAAVQREFRSKVDRGNLVDRRLDDELSAPTGK